MKNERNKWVLIERKKWIREIGNKNEYRKIRT